MEETLGMAKKSTCFVLLSVLFLLLPFPSVRADRWRVLDAALSMLEEGNPFLTRYNEDTGAGIEARFSLGCPYFWGGRDVKKIPEPAFPAQSSEYYSTEKRYLYGLDCVGFTRWVMAEAGFAPHDTISNLLNRGLYKEYANYPASKATGKERMTKLRVGDLLAIQHPSGGFHIAMYIGSLFDFGYTVKTLPEELSPYLYYPLLIHCTGSGEYRERYRRYIAERFPDTEESGEAAVLPPYGGVIVTILDVPPSEAPYRAEDIDGQPVPCFILEGYCLQITDLAREKQTRWIRWEQKP